MSAKILIVDDEANTLASLSRAFRLTGHEAAVCDNAARALELAQAQAFDLILSDVVMPKRDGLALLEDLRNAGVATPVVMMSGQAHIEMAVRATRLGGMTVFTPKRPDGSAAAFEGASAPLRVPPLSPQALFRIFYQASIRASRAAGHTIAFETLQDADPLTAGPMADAASVTSEALLDMAALPGGKATLGRVNDVVIAQGGKTGVGLQKGVLTVTIVSSQGVFGRPSSRRIERVAGTR